MFYTFNQNNSGGRFVINDSVSKYVIIEANSTEQANKIAEGIGIYFNGCVKGVDCPCCGDRWYEAYEGTKFPEIYGISALEYKYGLCSSLYKENGKYFPIYIYYLSGEKEIVQP